MSMDWTELFADFEQNLTQWLRRAVEPPCEQPPQQTEPAILRLFEERLQRLQTFLDTAERDGEQAFQPLTIDIQAIHQWLDALNTARVKLLEYTPRPISN